MGDLRVQIGTLTMSDGSGGSSVSTGMNYIFYANAMTTDITRATINHTTNGYISVTTATSGMTFQVIVFGQ
jgi:hypothetical protein